MTLTVDIIDDAKGFAELRSIWEALETLDDHCTPFNTWVWLYQWWQHYGEGKLLHLLVLKSHGRPVGIAPFYLQNAVMLNCIRYRKLRFIGAGGDTSPDYLNVIAEPAMRDAVVQAVVDSIFTSTDWRELWLSDINVEAPLYQSLVKRTQQSPGLTPESPPNALFINHLAATWDDYRQSLSRKRRKQINHQHNRLEKAGVSSIRVCETPEEIVTAYRAMIDLHHKRWASKGALGGFRSDAYIQFHESIVRQWAAEDRIWMTVMTLNDAIIGVQYAYRWRGCVQFFQSGFAPEHTDLSPGSMMFNYSIKHAIETGMQEIDLLKGAYDYKSAFSNDVRYTASVVYIKPGITAYLRRFRQWVDSMRQPHLPATVNETPQPPESGVSSR